MDEFYKAIIIGIAFLIFWSPPLFIGREIMVSMIFFIFMIHCVCASVWKKYKQGEWDTDLLLMAFIIAMIEGFPLLLIK